MSNNVLKPRDNEFKNVTIFKLADRMRSMRTNGALRTEIGGRFFNHFNHCKLYDRSTFDLVYT